MALPNEQKPAGEFPSFEDFMRQRTAAGRAYVRGEPALLRFIAARAAPVTFFGPQGGVLEGTEKVLAHYEEDAAQFEAGGTSTLDIRHMAAANGLAYWTGIQRASVRIRGKRTSMVLRVTEVFRFEDNGWKLIHRHADPLVSTSRTAKK
jgi:ketosteroid isomerase-like protein